MRNRWITCVFLVFVSLYFLVMARTGLRTGINSDDVVNLGFYAFQPAGELVKSNVFYFSPAYRPAGALFYRPIFDKFGLFSPPYRIVCFALLVANLWLACLAIRAFTGSLEVAAIATLIAAFHPRFRDLYTSSGTIYDILCFTFYFGGWLYYLRARREGPVRRVHQFAIVLILYICALNSKEMAVTFPVLLVLTESEKSGALLSRCRVAIVAACATIPYIWGKLDPASPLRNSPGYRPEIGVHSFLTHYGSYLDALLYRDGIARSHWFGSSQVAILFAGMLAIALLLRSRHLLFAWSMTIVSFLPIAFIAPRAAYVFYIPFVFWALYAALFLVWLRDRIVARPMMLASIDGRRLILAAIVFLLLIRAHRVERTRMGGATELGQPLIASILDALHRNHPDAPRGSTVLAVNDPYPRDQFGLVLLLRLYFRDINLQLDHADEDRCGYARVIEWCAGSVAMIGHTGPCKVVPCDSGAR